MYPGCYAITKRYWDSSPVPDTVSLSSPHIISFLSRRSPNIHNLNTRERHIATVCLRWLLYVVLIASCSVLYFGLLSAPTSMYSTVGKRCLCFRFVVPTFGCPCLGLLSDPNSTVQYCWREVSVSVIVLLSLLSVVPVSVYCQVPTVPHSTVGDRCPVQYCWREVSLFSFYCSYFRLSLFRFFVR
jgi:hypothetical protein